MKRRDHIGTYLSVAILALTLMPGLVGSVGAQATINAVHKSDGRPGSDLGNGDVPQSEMRSVIERYTADRGSLARFFSVEASPTRRARMKQFYTRMARVTREAQFRFDESGRTASTTSCSRIISITNCANSTFRKRLSPKSPRSRLSRRRSPNSKTRGAV